MPAHCDVCGEEICPHGICSANWCGHDHECAYCFTENEIERWAEQQAKFYEGWAKVFEEETK